MTFSHTTRHDSPPGTLRRTLTTLILVLGLAAGFSPIQAAAPRLIAALHADSNP